MSRCGYQSLIYVFFAWILAACGGGGGGGVDPSAGNITGGSSGSVSLTLQDSAGNPITNISGSTSAFLVAQLSGSNISNRIVSFSLTDPYGRLNPSSGRTVSDSNGLASIQVFAGTELGSGIASVVADTGAFDRVVYNISGTEEETSTVPSNTTLDVNIYKAAAYQATPQSKDVFQNGEEVTRDVSAIVEAQLTTTSATESVENLVVSFSTDTAELTRSTAITDSNGIAYVVLTAGSIAGAGTVTASVSGISKGARFATAGDDVDTTTTEPTIVQNFSLSDASDTSRNITTSTNGILTVLLEQGSPLPFENINVAVTGQGILEYTFPGTTRTISGQSLDVLTDSTGQAVLNIIPGSISGNGNVISTYNGTQTSNSIGYNIIADEIEFGAIVGTDNTIINNFEESVIEIDTTTLSAGSTAVLEVAAIKGSPATLFTESFDVTFTSSCIAAGSATVDSPVTAINGIAVATYTNNSCTGDDIITATASIGGQTFQANRAAGSTTSNTAIISNSSAVATSLAMTNITETLLALKNTSGLGRSETSNITFTATDSGGNPVASQAVNFELTTDVGGITFTPPTADTNASGQVRVTITSGTVPTPVRVKANMTVGSTTISSVSEQLNIGIGLPDQDSFSMALESFAIQAYNNEDAQNGITLSAADHFGNPAVTGTTFTVIADKGGRVGTIVDENFQAQPSCEIENKSITTLGSCTLTWLNSGDRPDADINRSTRTNIAPLTRAQNDRFGRTNLLAYAIGEETFYDSNGNGLFDVECSNCIDTNGDGTLDGDLDINGDGTIDPTLSEAFDDIGEPFADTNEDGEYTNDQIDANDPTPGDSSDDITETFVDFNSNLTYDGPNGVFDGALCSQAAISAGHCASLTYVWDEDTFAMSTDGGIFYFRDSNPLAGNYEYEQSGNPPSNISLSTEVANLSGSAPTISLTAGAPSDTINILITDANANNIPAGSTITITCSNCDVTAGDTHTVLNSSNPGVYSTTLNRPTSVTQTSGQLTVKYATPDGTEVSASYPVSTPP